MKSSYTTFKLNFNYVLKLNQLKNTNYVKFLGRYILLPLKEFRPRNYTYLHSGINEDIWIAFHPRAPTRLLQWNDSFIRPSPNV